MQPTGTGLKQTLDEVTGSVAGQGAILQGNVGDGLKTTLDQVVKNVANTKRAIVEGVRLSVLSPPFSSFSPF